MYVVSVIIVALTFGALIWHFTMFFKAEKMRKEQGVETLTSAIRAERLASIAAKKSAEEQEAQEARIRAKEKEEERVRLRDFFSAALTDDSVREVKDYVKQKHSEQTTKKQNGNVISKREDVSADKGTTSHTEVQPKAEAKISVKDAVVHEAILNPKSKDVK